MCRPFIWAQTPYKQNSQRMLTTKGPIDKLETKALG
jgi:hypothetical protein